MKCESVVVMYVVGLILLIVQLQYKSSCDKIFTCREK